MRKPDKLPPVQTIWGWGVVWRYTDELHIAHNCEDVEDRTYRVFGKKKDAIEYVGGSKLMRVVPVEMSYQPQNKKP